MAQIGLQYLICAPITETPTSVTYANGMVMSYAIKVDISIETNEGTLYADNRIVEDIKEFKSGKLTIGGDHLSYEVWSTIIKVESQNAQKYDKILLSLILGHQIETLTPNGKKLTAKGDDDGAYVGVGFYATTIKNGTRKYRAIWLHKIKFGIPNESLETKGDSIKFQTPTIDGTILTDILGIWKEEAIFDTEAGAKAWLDGLADIGGAA